MKKRIPDRTHPASSITLAVLTLLAIFVAPICAPLCAAGACTPSANQGQCHEMASMIANGSEQFAAANKTCESSDFSAVLVKSDESSFSYESVQSHSTVALYGRSTEKTLANLSASAADLSVHLVPLQLADSHLMSAILRI